MKPNYTELLKQKREKKYRLLKEQHTNTYECNYAEGDKCAACTHSNWCIFSKERITYEDKYAKLKTRQKDLTNYLNTGKDTYGYDKNKLRLELYKLKKKIGELNENKN